MSSSKVFVGNFSFDVDDAKLKEYFAEIGTVVSAKVMTEGHGGRSRGFGFVEFTSEEEARQAIEKLDSSTWNGRVVKVSEDRSMRRGGERFSRPGGPSGGYSRGGNGAGADRGQRFQPMGYFRAQPLDIGIRKRKKTDPFCEVGGPVIDYKDPKMLVRYMSERGRILPRRMTGLTSTHQRMVTRAIKRAQHLALLPTTGR